MTGDTIRLSTAQRFLMQDLQDGHAIQRRGRGADQVFFTQNGSWYIRSPRPVADALVRKGLAHWIKSDRASTFQFVLKEGPK